MRRRRPAAGLALAAGLLLAGCESRIYDLAPPPAPPATEACVESGCGEKRRLVSIPDAENLLFAPDGRLFVSGGVNVYEIGLSGSSYTAQPLFAGSDNFTGLAIRQGVLYANGFGGTLYAGRLDARPMALAAIHATGLDSANGLTAGPDGELYLVNGPLTQTPAILRLRLDALDPLKVLSQETWLPLTPGMNFPNGVQLRGRTLYYSESTPTTPGRIRRVEILADGRAGTPEDFASLGTSLPDDFSLPGDDLLLASYFSDGRIGLFDRSGALLSATDPGSFDSPSQVRLGQPPLFAPTDLVVTEKGVLRENDSTVGNALSVYRRRGS